MKTDEVYLRHNLDESDFLIRECENIKLEDFINNEVLLRASSRSLEIIGEAVKNISSEFKINHKDIQWKKISGLRDKLIHNYFGVNWDIVWNVIKHHIPKLKKQLENLLK